jgi:hypothetical protein
MTRKLTFAEVSNYEKTGGAGFPACAGDSRGRLSSIPSKTFQDRENRGKIGTDTIFRQVHLTIAKAQRAPGNKP